MLYGGQSRTTVLNFRRFIHIDEAAEVVKFPLSVERALYFWMKSLNLLLDNTVRRAISNPLAHSEAVKAVSDVCDCFFKVIASRTAPKQLFIPNSEDNSSKELPELTLLIQRIHVDYCGGDGELPVPSVNGLMSLFGN